MYLVNYDAIKRSHVVMLKGGLCELLQIPLSDRLEARGLTQAPPLHAPVAT